MATSIAQTHLRQVLDVVLNRVEAVSSVLYIFKKANAHRRCIGRQPAGALMQAQTLTMRRARHPKWALKVRSVSLEAKLASARCQKASAVTITIATGQLAYVKLAPGGTTRERWCVCFKNLVKKMCRTHQTWIQVHRTVQHLVHKCTQKQTGGKSS